MIDAFEAALTDLLANALAGDQAISEVLRVGRGTGQPAAGMVRLEAGVLSATASDHLGDDLPERFGNRREGITTRPVFWLDGMVQIELRMRRSNTSRQTLVRTVDRVLVALHSTTIRTGRSFTPEAEQNGFALDGGLRLVALDSEAATNATLTYHYAGRFWPTTAPESGESIRSTHLRQVSLPLRVATALRARAGGPELLIPVAVDLMAPTPEAAPVLAARLLGSEPPGSLSGNTDAPREGFVGLEEEGGVYPLRYTPPETLESPSVVNAELVLLGEAGGFSLASVRIEVLP